MSVHAAPGAGSEVQVTSACPITQSDRQWPAETALVRQHVTGEPSNRSTASARSSRKSPSRRSATTGSSTVTTASAVIRRPLTRCSTPMAMCAAVQGIFAELAPSDASELAARSDALAALHRPGDHFSLSGQERPFPLTWCKVISAAEWSRLERGITQRSRRWRCTSTTSTASRRSCVTA